MASRTWTEEDWGRVFRLRCLSKQGRELSSRDRRFLQRAFQEDGCRYAAMDADVFDATVPFGSGSRARRVVKDGDLVVGGLRSVSVEAGCAEAFALVLDADQGPDEELGESDESGI